MKEYRQNYDIEFKKMAVELLNSGKSSAEVGRELGISHDTAIKWKRKLEGDNNLSKGSTKSLSDIERENLELKKKLKDAELERDILKKAVSIFSKNDGKSSLL